MSINTTLSGLSQTASLNGPDGAADLPSQYDDAIRYHGAFIAQLRDGSGYTAGAIVAGLGYTPVHQGGGTSQLTNQIFIGWSAGTTLRVQVDGTDFGATWPIGIVGNAGTATVAASCSGNSATATNATTAASCSGNSATATTAAACSGNAATATTAANSSALGGAAAAEYIRRSTGDAITIGWSGSRIILAVNGNNFGGIMPFDIAWTSVQSRPTALSQFTNDIQAPTSGSFNGVNTASAVMPTGGGCSWSALAASDERVKENVAPTAEDSLAKIAALEFVQFDYRADLLPEYAAAGHRRVGLIAQQAQAIDTEFAIEVPHSEYLHINDQPLLMAALHAIKQLQARVAALEAGA